MIEVVGVSFKKNGKVYYFSPNHLKIEKGTNVIVKTERGMQLGTIEFSNMEIDNSKLKSSLNQVIRVATDKDEEKHLKNTDNAKEALSKCKELIKKYNLKMAVLEANFTFDKSQLLITFLADNRVDFRKLAKELASIYKTRIELRQVGVRDKAKEIGGCGQCGRPLCCSKFLCDFDSVSINMAKTQNIALNPNKVNGVCGRLLCCLKYENECYKDLQKTLPRIGESVETEFGNGRVISIDVLKQKYRVDIKDHGIEEIEINNYASNK